MDNPTHKMVNGVSVPLTDEEIQEILAEWQKNASTQQAQINFEQAVAAGFDTGLGWNLPIDDDSRAALSQLRLQILEGVNFGIWTDDSVCPVELRDVGGELHQLTIGQIRILIFQAGNYYAQLLGTLRSLS